MAQDCIHLIVALKIALISYKTEVDRACANTM